MVCMSEPKRKPGRPKNPDSKRSKGSNRHKKPRKSFHADPELFAAMDAYRTATRPTPDESEILRTALEEFLVKRGFPPPKSDS
jgi:hypothetical protein